MKESTTTILIVALYVTVFIIAVTMSIRVEQTRKYEQNRHEAFWHQAQENNQGE